MQFEQVSDSQRLLCPADYGISKTFNVRRLPLRVYGFFSVIYYQGITRPCFQSRIDLHQNFPQITQIPQKLETLNPER